MNDFNKKMERMLRVYYKVDGEHNDKELNEELMKYKCIDYCNCDLHQKAFLLLYKMMEKRLKKVITDVTYIYPDKIKKQKYSKIFNIEKRLSRTINMTELMERYKDEYIQEVCNPSYDRFINNKYDLTSPFWEFLQSLNCKKIQEDTKRLNISYSRYLALKFCDKYWMYIEKCLRRDFGSRKYYKVEYINDMTSLQYSFSYEMDLDNAIYVSKLITDLEKILTKRELQVWKLLILGLSHSEISSILDISVENCMRIKCITSKKFSGIIDEKES